MVKLSADVIQKAPQCFNPCQERMLDLRGAKVSVIENLGATLDQFDCIDFSDNDIRKIDGFPLLYRLKTLLFNNNRICRVGENLRESLPSLESLILTNNMMQELGDLDALASLKKLQYLSLVRNPVANHPQYRLYVIHRIPWLRVLDFRKIKQQERDEAASMFKGKKGRQLEKELGQKTKTITPGLASAEPSLLETATAGRTPAEVEAIKSAIASARSLEEVERLHEMLAAGEIPGNTPVNGQPAAGGTMIVEEEEDDMEIE